MSLVCRFYLLSVSFLFQASSSHQSIQEEEQTNKPSTLSQKHRTPRVFSCAKRWLPESDWKFPLPENSHEGK